MFETFFGPVFCDLAGYLRMYLRIRCMGCMLSLGKVASWFGWSLLTCGKCVPTSLEVQSNAWFTVGAFFRLHASTSGFNGTSGPLFSVGNFSSRILLSSFVTCPNYSMRVVSSSKHELLHLAYVVEACKNYNLQFVGHGAALYSVCRFLKVT